LKWSLDLSHDDAQDRDHWRPKIKAKLAEPGLHGKWLLKWCVYVCVYWYTSTKGELNPENSMA